MTVAPVAPAAPAKRPRLRGAGHNGPAATPVVPERELKEAYLTAIRLSDVKPERVKWLWPGRVPSGKLTVLAGVPGKGKSFVTLDMAARISVGADWPDLPGQAALIGSTLLLAAEDGLADTVRHRLDAAGADCQKVIALQEAVFFKQWHGDPDPSRSIDLAHHVWLIEKQVEAIGDVRLIVVDPVTAYIHGADDATNKEGAVRPILQSLAAMAERHQLAVVAVMHLRKAVTPSALHRIAGSGAFSAVPRAVWMLDQHPDDPDLRRLLPAKMSVAKSAPGAAFRISNGRVEWLEGTLEENADQAYAPEPRRGRGPGREKQRAMEFLRETLKPGVKVERNEVVRLAMEAEIKEVTLIRASREVGVVKSNDDKPGNPYMWWIPEAEDEADAS